MKRNILSVVAILIIVCISIVISIWPWKWVIFHGWTAAKHADRLLNGSKPTTESRFINYTIYTASGCVIFATHEDDRIMVYCPDGDPTDTKKIGYLEHVFGPWYKGLSLESGVSKDTHP